MGYRVWRKEKDKKCKITIPNTLWAIPFPSAESGRRSACLLLSSRILTSAFRIILNTKHGHASQFTPNASRFFTSHFPVPTSYFPSGSMECIHRVNASLKKREILRQSLRMTGKGEIGRLQWQWKKLRDCFAELQARRSTRNDNPGRNSAIFLTIYD